MNIDSFSFLSIKLIGEQVRITKATTGIGNKEVDGDLLNYEKEVQQNQTCKSLLL